LAEGSVSTVSNYWADPAPFHRLDEVRRQEPAVAALWPAACVLLVSDRGGFGVVHGSDGPQLRTEPASTPYDPARHWLLGRVGDQAWFATPEPVDSPMTIREVGSQLSPPELGLATMAAALEEWHRLEPHCPRCGGLTTVIAAGMARSCQACGRELFPRTDPAVIVAVTDESDRLLLGHQGVWPVGRYSVLAGFVEAGESLEQAVHREVYEEAGILLRDVTYVASQPWPFPRSVMLGFHAVARTTDIVVDGEEIVEARWFTREELLAEVDQGTVGLPGASSIAHRLVSAWLNPA